MDRSAIRQNLMERLLQEHCLWSLEDGSKEDVSDAQLIEKCLVYLDLDDIDRLFAIFPRNKVKTVWREVLIPQDEYYHAKNRLFARHYFGIKRPDAYLKSTISRYYHLLCKA